jgi:hypothetical protein
MNPIVIDVNSFVYRFSNWGMPKRDRDDMPQDICQFRRMLILAIIRVSVILVFTFGYAFSFTRAIMLLITSPSLLFANKPTLLDFLALSSILLTLAIMMAAIIITITNWYIEVKNNKPESPPGPIKLVYQSWKGKYCHPVVVKSVEK